MKTIFLTTGEEAKEKASAPAPGPASERSAALPRPRTWSAYEDDPEPETSILGNRSLWLAPLAAEAVLCIGAIWLSRSLDGVIWSTESGFPLLSFLVLVLVYVGLARYSHACELFMPRAVVLIGVGTLVLATLGTGLYFTAEGYIVGGLYQLRYMPLVLVPLALFLTRCFFVFRAARSAPALSRFIVRPRGRVSQDQMRKLRAKLRYWLR